MSEPLISDEDRDRLIRETPSGVGVLRDLLVRHEALVRRKLAERLNHLADEYHDEQKLLTDTERATLRWAARIVEGEEGMRK